MDIWKLIGLEHKKWAIVSVSRTWKTSWRSHDCPLSKDDHAVVSVFNTQSDAVAAMLELRKDAKWADIALSVEQMAAPDLPQAQQNKLPTFGRLLKVSRNRTK